MTAAARKLASNPATLAALLALPDRGRGLEIAGGAIFKEAGGVWGEDEGSPPPGHAAPAG
ncbi:MAG: hypothetical protein R3B70_21520 [Polyangiaceae bacterium]